MAKHQEDIQGWLQTKWGMTESEIQTALSGLKWRKTERADYGENYAELVVDDAEIGGFPFEVVFQMSKKTDRLAKVAMRHKPPFVRSLEDVIKAVFNGLASTYGAPEMLDRPTLYRWSLPSTTIQLVSVDTAALVIVAIMFEPKARMESIS